MFWLICLFKNLTSPIHKRVVRLLAKCPVASYNTCLDNGEPMSQKILDFGGYLAEILHLLKTSIHQHITKLKKP